MRHSPRRLKELRAADTQEITQLKADVAALVGVLHQRPPRTGCCVSSWPSILPWSGGCPSSRLDVTPHPPDQPTFRASPVGFPASGVQTETFRLVGRFGPTRGMGLGRRQLPC